MIQSGVSKLVQFMSLTAAGAANTSAVPTTLVSKNGGAAAATANTPVLTSGGSSWSLTLTAAEMAADVVTVEWGGSGLVPGCLTLYTEAAYLPAGAQTGDAYARLGAAGAGLTALGDTRIANLDATVSSRAKPSDVPSAAAIATAVWAATTRSLTTFGTLATDTAAAVWAATTRTLSSFGTLAATIAASILKTPANLIATDTNGYTTANNAALSNLDAPVSTRSTLGGVAQTGDAYARLGAPAGASHAADIASVKTDTASILSTLGGMATACATAVWAAGTRTLTSLGAIVSSVAAAILKTPANLLATDSTGAVALPATAPDGYGASSGGLTAAQAAQLAAIKAQTDKLGTASAAVMQTAITDTGAMTVTAAADLDAVFTVTVPSGYTALWFTAKAYPGADLDAAALIQISAAGGLLTLGGTTAAAAAQGGLSVDAAAGTVTVHASAAATAKLMPLRNAKYDIKVRDAAGAERVLAAGALTIVRTPTLTV
jgi:hypothetical protein